MARGRAPKVSSVADLSDLRIDATTPAARARLEQILAAAAGRLVAEAAKIIRAQQLPGFDAALAHSFERLIEDGATTDVGCVGKIAVLEALDFAETMDPAPFVGGIHLRQLEAAWGPPIDTAAGVRSRSLRALARIRDSRVLLFAAEHLVDGDDPVREAAADAVAHYGDPAGGALLLLKLKTGDAEYSVLLACMSALLALVPREGLRTASEALRGHDRQLCEAAALALGECRVEEAVELLLGELSAVSTGPWRKTLVTALAVHRSERALAAVMALVASSSVADAEMAVRALRPRMREAAVHERVMAAVQRSVHKAALLPLVSA